MGERGDSLRVSDAERDVTLKTLNDNAAVGRLTRDELDERAGQAMTAKTRGELVAIMGGAKRFAGHTACHRR